MPLIHRKSLPSLFALVFVAVAALARPGLGQSTGPQALAEPSPLRFVVTYDESISRSFTGRVYVITTESQRREPRRGPSWFRPAPFFAVDVIDWKPNDPLIFHDDALGYPGLLSTIATGNYAVQTVMRLNPDAPTIGAAGNAYSVNARFQLDAKSSGTITLHIDQVDKAQPFPETDRIKLAQLRSDLLSEFHGRDMMMRAAIILPQDYDEKGDRRYPAYYWIGGFGSDHRIAPRMRRTWDATGYADRIVRIVLDPTCYGGHHVFADSANNGPVGQALVEEFIPYLEKTFPLTAAPTARFVSGHSSGGWASLWLQITYPDFFGGVWSLAPDPIDFRDFQRINLYEPDMYMYVDAEGNQRPVARRGDQVMLWYEPFAKLEVILGEGGQLRSFEWVFSPRGPDGLPRPLYDRETGAVNHVVAQSWKRYDIHLILQNNWSTLGPILQGKLHIIAGELDTFYLEGPVRALKESLQRLGSDAVIEIVPGATHGSFATPDLRKRIDEQLLAIFEMHHGLPATRAEPKTPATVPAY
ncbi:MAG: alpha/beta hydrolase [Planctomycetes bacterium]|nr:alpha/beta hydrolase [Planctomycetota bacterium]